MVCANFILDSIVQPATWGDNNTFSELIKYSKALGNLSFSNKFSKDVFSLVPLVKKEAV